MLKTEIPKYYVVLNGQTTEEIARAFSLPPSLLVRENNLKEEVYAGQILSIPNIRGNLYKVKMGDTKELLCGSEESFEKKNGTKILFPGQTVLL